MKPAPGTGIDYYEHKVVWNNVVVYDSAPNAGGGASPAPKTGSDGAIYTGGVQTSSAGASEYHILPGHQNGQY